MSKHYSDVSVFLGGGVGGGEGEHAQKPKFGDEKKKFIRHFARFNCSRRSLAFISKYYHACGEKIITLASKYSVKLDEKFASDSTLSEILQETLFPVHALHIYLRFSPFQTNF